LSLKHFQINNEIIGGQKFLQKYMMQFIQDLEQFQLVNKASGTVCFSAFGTVCLLFICFIYLLEEEGGEVQNERQLHKYLT
jgi:hypothetical protein